MFDLHFIRPWVLLLLFILGAFVYLCFQQDKRFAKLPIAEHLIAHLQAGEGSRGWFAPKRILPWVLAIMIISAAGPTWQPEADAHSKNQSPIILVIDLSKSMAQSDLAPSRLENSKMKLDDILALKKDGLFGAYVYAGSGHLLTPPTEDREILELYLSSLSTNLVPRQGKDLSGVLKQIEAKRAHSTAPASIIVVTDGIDHSARQAIEQYQQQSNDQLLVWKFGYSDSVSAPRGVEFVQNTADTSDVHSIVRWIDNFRYFDPQDKDIRWQEAGYYLVFPVLLASLLWFRRGWTIRWLPSVLIMLSSTSLMMPAAALANETSQRCNTTLMSWFMTEDQQGRWHYERQDYQCAAQSFVDPQWKIEALMRNQQWEWALTMLANEPDSVQKSFNVGLSYLHLQRFRSAQRWFEQVLDAEPEHPQAQHNLDLLEDIFELMAERAQGQGTAGEDMTADVIASLQEDMEIEEPEDKVEVINSADLMAEEHLTKIWLEQVKSNPQEFLRNKFAIQMQNKLELEVQP